MCIPCKAVDLLYKVRTMPEALLGTRSLLCRSSLMPMIRPASQTHNELIILPP